MVANVGGYRWSSFLANATGRENVMIAPHPAYQKLGDTQAARAYAYRKSFDEEPDGVDRSVIDEEIRTAAQEQIKITLLRIDKALTAKDEN